MLNRSEAAVDVPLTEMGDASQMVFGTDPGVGISGSTLQLPPMTGALVSSTRLDR